jgi:hypothetical protein
MNRFTQQLPAIDVHQHLWPEPLLEALRVRQRPPRLRGWALELEGVPDYPVEPADHDLANRTATLAEDGVDLALVSLSSALGVETLPPTEARTLIDAYHVGVSTLPADFGAWAAACLSEPDPDSLEAALARGLVGLQLPATALLDESGYDHAAPLLSVLERQGRPLFIHPGPARRPPNVPPWWPALVAYPMQMHAAWHAFAAFGRPRHPHLRVCFGLLAGLAPLHGERALSRVGLRSPTDDLVFLETSSYGARAIDATVRVLGVDTIVGGSDRPYAKPVPADLGPALTHALRCRNPARLFEPQEVSHESVLAARA